MLFVPEIGEHIGVNEKIGLVGSRTPLQSDPFWLVYHFVNTGLVIDSVKTDAAADPREENKSWMLCYRSIMSII